MTKPTCTVHASGVFSLFSALAFASRGHTIKKIVFFDYRAKFGGLYGLIKKISPVLDAFDLAPSIVTYVTHEDQVTANIAAIYDVRDTRIVFAESLQSKRVQDLLRLLGPEEIHFYAEGAMSFGPVRDGLPGDLSRLLHSVHYVDYAGLRPIALRQFKANDAGMNRDEFKGALLRLFSILDASYSELTEVEAFNSGVPSNGIVILHQNLSAISGFDPKAERDIFSGIQRQVMAAWQGQPVVFMHPKGIRNVPDIFDVQLRSPTGAECIFVAPPFPMAEYYIHKISPKICIGIFSSGLLNLKVLGIPVVTIDTSVVGHKIKSAFDSNLYALHFAQMVLGSTEHERCIYPSVDFDRLIERLNENDRMRCPLKTVRLWELPYYIGDEHALASNLQQVKADWIALDAYRGLPAFRRLSPHRKEMLATATLSEAKLRKRKLEKRAVRFYSRMKKTANSIFNKVKKA